MWLRATIFVLIVLFLADWAIFDGYYWVQVVHQVRHFLRLFLNLDWAGFLS